MPEISDSSAYLDALLRAQLADHVLDIELQGDAEESEVLDLLQQIVEGPLFRLSRGTYAFMLPPQHIDALSEALGDVDGTLRAVTATAPDHADPLAEQFLGALKRAATGSSPTLLAHAAISAAFAVEAARLAAAGLRAEGLEPRDSVDRAPSAGRDRAAETLGAEAADPSAAASDDPGDANAGPQGAPDAGPLPAGAPEDRQPAHDGIDIGAENARGDGVDRAVDTPRESPSGTEDQTGLGDGAPGALDGADGDMTGPARDTAQDGAGGDILGSAADGPSGGEHGAASGGGDDSAAPGDGAEAAPSVDADAGGMGASEADAWRPADETAAAPDADDQESGPQDAAPDTADRHGSVAADTHPADSVISGPTTASDPATPSNAPLSDEQSADAQTEGAAQTEAENASGTGPEDDASQVAVEELDPAVDPDCADAGSETAASRATDDEEAEVSGHGATETFGDAAAEGAGEDLRGDHDDDGAGFQDDTDQAAGQTDPGADRDGAPQDLASAADGRDPTSAADTTRQGDELERGGAASNASDNKDPGAAETSAHTAPDSALTGAGERDGDAAADPTWGADEPGALPTADTDGPAATSAAGTTEAPMPLGADSAGDAGKTLVDAAARSDARTPAHQQTVAPEHATVPAASSPDPQVFLALQDQLGKLLERMPSAPTTAPGPQVVDLAAVTSLLAERLPDAPPASSAQVAELTRRLSEMEQRVLSTLPSGEKVFQMLRQRLDGLQASADKMLSHFAPGQSPEGSGDDDGPSASDRAALKSALDGVMSRLDGMRTALEAPDALPSAAEETLSRLARHLETIEAALSPTADSGLHAQLAALAEGQTSGTLALAKLGEETEAAAARDREILAGVAALTAGLPDAASQAPLAALHAEVSRAAAGSDRLEDLAEQLSTLVDSRGESTAQLSAIEATLHALQSEIAHIGREISAKHTDQPAAAGPQAELSTRVDALTTEAASLGEGGPPTPLSNPAPLSSPATVAAAAGAAAPPPDQTDIDPAIPETAAPGADQGHAATVAARLSDIAESLAQLTEERAGLAKTVAGFATEDALADLRGDVRDLAAHLEARLRPETDGASNAMDPREKAEPTGDPLLQEIATQLRSVGADVTSLKQAAGVVPTGFADLALTLETRIAALAGTLPPPSDAGADAPHPDGIATGAEDGEALRTLGRDFETLRQRWQGAPHPAPVDLLAGFAALGETLTEVLERLGSAPHESVLPPGDAPPRPVPVGALQALRHDLSAMRQRCEASDPGASAALEGAVMALGPRLVEVLEGHLAVAGVTLPQPGTERNTAVQAAHGDAGPQGAAMGPALPAGMRAAFDALGQRLERFLETRLPGAEVQRDGLAAPDPGLSEALSLLPGIAAQVQANAGDLAALTSGPGAVSSQDWAALRQELSDLAAAARQSHTDSAKATEPGAAALDAPVETLLAEVGAALANPSAFTDRAARIQSLASDLAAEARTMGPRPGAFSADLTALGDRVSETVTQGLAALEARLADGSSPGDGDIPATTQDAPAGETSVAPDTALREMVERSVAEIQHALANPAAALSAESHRDLAARLDRLAEDVAARDRSQAILAALDHLAQRGAEAPAPGHGAGAVDALLRASVDPVEALSRDLARAQDVSAERAELQRDLVLRVLSQAGEIQGETRAIRDALQARAEGSDPATAMLTAKLDTLGERVDAIADLSTALQQNAGGPEAAPPQAAVLERLAALRGEARRQGDYLERLEAKLPPSDDAPFAARLDALETQLASMPERVCAALADQAAAMGGVGAPFAPAAEFDALKTALTQAAEERAALDRRVAMLSERVETLAGSHSRGAAAEREGVAKLSVALQTVLRRLDTQVDALETTAARAASGEGQDPRLAGLEQAIEDLRADFAARRRPTEASEDQRKGLATLSVALQHMLRRIDTQVLRLEEEVPKVAGLAELRHDLRHLVAEVLAEAKRDMMDAPAPTSAKNA